MIKENIIYNHIHITDYNYFSMIDNQVRSEYTLCEEYTLLPLVENLYKINGISTEDIKHYPVEGYYYKTKGLTRFFQLIRNLQENNDVYDKVNLQSKEAEDLKWLLGNSIWGTVESKRSLTPFPRMKDILTHTLNSLLFKPNWTIENILKTIDNFATGNPNLVELAYLTNDIRCLTAGAETNALYREISFCCSGAMIGSFEKIVDIYHWDVSEKVQNLGEKLIDKYNEVLNKFQKEISESNDYRKSMTSSRDLKLSECHRITPKLLIKPTIENHNDFNNKLEFPRVAMLGQCLDDGQYYHWILDNDKVTERWADGVITT